MDFSLNDKQKMLVNMVRKMADKEFKANASIIDKEASYPWEHLKKLSEAGLMGLSIPEKYGGSEAGHMSVVLVVENLARVCLTTAGIVSLHSGACSNAIVHFGSEKLKQRFLPGMAKGEILPAYAQIEPNAGSDVGSITTKAQDKGDYYLVNGRKAFISNAAEGSIFVTIVRLGEQKGTRGLGCIIIEKDTPGLAVGKKEEKLGFRGYSCCDVIFEDCKVPKENLLVPEGGFRKMMEAMNAERCYNAAFSLGIAQGAFDEALRYSKERPAFGRLISQFQAIQYMLADMKMKIDAARLLIYRAATNAEKGLPNPLETSLAKAYANEMVCEVTDKAVRIHGGYGFLKEYPVERMLRDARFPQLGGGTIEMQKNTIGRLLVKD